MKTKLAAAAAILLWAGLGAFAHRLDEYLQASIISVDKNQIQVSMRLVPGVAVTPKVLASIDTDGDGVISEAERQAYAERVLRDVFLRSDGKTLRPRLLSVTFPNIDEMQQGRGEIHIEFIAELPGGGTNRKFTFENRHQSSMSAYLVNCLVPRDRDIHIVSQNRNENQSCYELDYTQVGNPKGGIGWRSKLRALAGNVGGLESMFRLGMRHIAEGTDHLLFLLALLLPAPVISFGSRWAGFAGWRSSLKRILRVVTAFTAGHSITLALAGLGIVLVPSSPVEVLIAVSILVSAVHAFRPLFPGREAVIAGLFGLIHGLAFAATLGQLGLGRWVRLANIFAFNTGIETMQLVVVAATMPSLVLLSRTRAYSWFRIGGALFAAVASTGWIVERCFNLHSFVDVAVNALAHRAGWLAAILFFFSIASSHRRQAGEALSGAESISDNPLEQSA